GGGGVTEPQPGDGKQPVLLPLGTDHVHAAWRYPDDAPVTTRLHKRLLRELRLVCTVVSPQPDMNDAGYELVGPDRGPADLRYPRQGPQGQAHGASHGLGRTGGGRWGWGLVMSASSPARPVHPGN